MRTQNKTNNPVSKGLLVLIIGILLLSIVTAGQWDIWVRPTINGSLQINQSFNYSYSFTTDSSCSAVLYQTETKNITTDTFGMSFLSFQLPTNLTNTQYICEYRNSSLRAALPLTTQLTNNSFTTNLSSQGNITTSSWFVGNVNWSSIQNYPGFINSSYYLATNPYGFYNSTNFAISDYYLKSNPFSFYNSTNFLISDYYLKSNPFNFYNITTLPDLNSTGLIRDWNTTGFIKDWNSTSLIKDWSYLSGGNASWNQSHANTLYYSISNPSGFITNTVNTSYYLVSNPFSFYNSTSIPAFLLTETDPHWSGNYTQHNASWSSIYNFTYHSWNKTYADTLYATIGSGGNTSFNQSLTDSLYYGKSNNLLSFWNSTFATFNKTYADTLYYDLNTNTRNYWNSTFATFNKTYADTLYSVIGSGNASWNQTFANTLYKPIGITTWNNTFADWNETYHNSRYPVANVSCSGTDKIMGFNNTTGLFYCGIDQTGAGGVVTGAGTANYITMWNSSSGINSSIIYQLGTSIGINTISPNNTLHVVGSGNITNLTISNLSSVNCDVKADATTGRLYCGTDASGGAGGNPFDQWVNTTSNVTVANLTATGNISAALDVFSRTFNLTQSYLYTTNNTFLLNGYASNNTFYPYSSNPFTFWNSTFATFNKTYADTLYASVSVITDNASWNQTHANTLYYSISNPSGFITNTVNASYYLVSNPYSYYNTTTIPAFLLISTAQNYFANGTNINNTNFNNGTLTSITTIQNYFTNGTNLNQTFTNTLYKPIGITTWNNTFADWNLTYAQTLFTTQTNTSNYFSNGTNVNITVLQNYFSNGTNYNNSNTYGFYNSTQQSWNVNLTNFFNVTNSTIQGLFYINASTGRIGIGTKIPQNTLNVVGESNVTDISYFGSNLSFQNKVLNVTSNTTCIKIYGATSVLEIC